VDASTEPHHHPTVHTEARQLGETTRSPNFINVINMMPVSLKPTAKTAAWEPTATLTARRLAGAGDRNVVDRPAKELVVLRRPSLPYTPPAGEHPGNPGPTIRSADQMASSRFIGFDAVG
jgi:hypothetical protein